MKETRRCKRRVNFPGNLELVEQSSFVICCCNSVLNSFSLRKGLLLKTLHRLATLKNCCFKQDFFNKGGVDTLIVIIYARAYVIMLMSGFYVFSESVQAYIKCALIYINYTNIYLTQE